MKKNFVLGVAVLMFAAISAFASAKTTNFIAVWYEDEELGCVQAEATACDNIGAPNCVVPLSGLGFSAQIFRDGPTPTDPLHCQNAYRP